jgi:transcriptional regulator with XRE-family HTH domain
MVVGIPTTQQIFHRIRTIEHYSFPHDFPISRQAIRSDGQRVEFRVRCGISPLGRSMLASSPSPEAGKRLKAARLRARLSIRDVERLSHEIASQESNPDCCISHSWLVQVENSEFVPGTFKLYTLCRLYKLKPEEILAFFGLGLRDTDGGYMSLNLPHTHLVGPIQERPGQTLVAPLGLRSTERLEQTNLVSRMFESWGEIPVGLLQQVDLRNSILGYIGLKDYTMYPLLRPGSLVQVDSRQRAIRTAGWPNEYERPIYFVEMRDSCVCSWCDLDGSQLFLIPGPLSGQQLRRVRYPLDAEIVGRVTGVVMSLVERQGA